MKRTAPSSFRKWTLQKRQEYLKKELNISDDELAIICGKCDLNELSTILIESSIGTYPLPFALSSEIIIDGVPYSLPLVTEEPSVIAAISYAGKLLSRNDGIRTEGSPSLLDVQVFLLNPDADGATRITKEKETIRTEINRAIPAMVERGGGFYDLSVSEVEVDSLKALCISLTINVCDAMGANCVNTIGENLKGFLAKLCGGMPLMAILSNAATKRLSRAMFAIDTKYLRKGEFSGEEIAKRIVAATQIAEAIPERAVTHNKGIMNGITALTLATGNDTRAVEAAAHFYAQKSGTYRPLTTYTTSEGVLKGTIELPTPLGTIGGTTKLWPPAQLALKLLGTPTAEQLGRISAAAGLAQNFAALLALTSEGIQAGHMTHHARRIAYRAGARGEAIEMFAKILSQKQCFNQEEANRLFKEENSSCV